MVATFSEEHLDFTGGLLRILDLHHAVDTAICVEHAEIFLLVAGLFFLFFLRRVHSGLIKESRLSLDYSVYLWTRASHYHLIISWIVGDHWPLRLIIPGQECSFTVQMFFDISTEGCEQSEKTHLSLVALHGVWVLAGPVLQLDK